MSDFNYQEYLRNNPLFQKETTILTEGKNNLLKQNKLSSSEYQKAKKLKDFSKDDYKFDSSEDLYVKKSTLKEETDYSKMHNVELVATYKDKFGIDSAKGLTRDELIKGLKYVKKSTLKENSIGLDNNLLTALTDLVDSHAATSGLTDEEAVMDMMEFLGQEYGIAFEFGRMMQEEMPGRVDMLASKIMKALNAGHIDKSESAELRKALGDGNIDFVEMILSDGEGIETDYMKRRREGDDYLQEETSKAKMSKEELKAKIKEDIYSILNEEEEDEVEAEEETEKVEVEDVEDMEPAEKAPAEGLSQDEKEIQDNLKLAYDNAIAIGDKKLADQIGNSITFFTRTHVVER